MCLFSSIYGVWLRSMENNIFTQIGFIVLVGLACKNAILIVEFAKQIQDRDQKDRFTAAVEACRLRLRPILMTSFAFIFGVVPLVVSSGAGAEMRQALGTAVFFGMLGVTGFGLFLTPVFYVVIMWFKERRDETPAPAPTQTAPPLAAEPALDTSAQGAQSNPWKRSRRQLHCSRGWCHLVCLPVARVSRPRLRTAAALLKFTVTTSDADRMLPAWPAERVGDARIVLSTPTASTRRCRATSFRATTRKAAW